MVMTVKYMLLIKGVNSIMTLENIRFEKLKGEKE